MQFDIPSRYPVTQQTDDLSLFNPFSCQNVNNFYESTVPDPESTSNTSTAKPSFSDECTSSVQSCSLLPSFHFDPSSTLHKPTHLVKEFDVPPSAPGRLVLKDASNLFKSPLGVTFKTTTPSNKPKTKLLLIVSNLYHSEMISAEEKGKIKDLILCGKVDLSHILTEYEITKSPANCLHHFRTALNNQSESAPVLFSGGYSSSPISFNFDKENVSEFDSLVVQKKVSGGPVVVKPVSGTSVFMLESVDIAPSHKIASFDFDDTLVQTKSGKRFATSGSDWKLLYPQVKTKLQQLYNQGYKLVIFTNQLGVGKGHMKSSVVFDRITAFVEEVQVPMQAFCAIQDDQYRKPDIGMWNLLKQFNGGQEIDVAASFFVGDAAGRPNDHSASDRKFAMNVGLRFETPEETFLGEAPAPFSLGIDLQEKLAQQGDLVEEGGEITSTEQEMIILVGFPASGKSTFAKRHLVSAGYVHVNRDTLKTQDKCLALARSALANGQSVVIDNTNPSMEARAPYLSVAREAGVRARCFYFKVDEQLANHLNMYREKKEGTAHVPKIGYAVYKKKFEMPSNKEGFAEVKTINFVPKFDSQQDQQLFLRFA